MIAYTFTRRGARCPFTDRIWRGDDGWLDDARATTAEMLPVWIAPELWRVELEGRVTTPAAQLVGERGRLVERVDAWDEAAASDWVTDCRRQTLRITSRRPGDLTLGYLARDVHVFTSAHTNVAGWLAAHAARVLDGDEGYSVERARQAGWLRERLGL